jgi:hypothetical protein
VDGIIIGVDQHPTLEDRMDKKAVERLGEDVIEMAVVQTTGTGRTLMAGSVGGIVGAIAAGTAASSGSRDQLLGYKGRMYMLVGPTRLGFFGLGPGLLKASVGEPLAVFSRNAVTSITFGGGMLTAAFTVNLDDGTALVLEAPRTEKGKVERMAALFPPPTA